MTKKQSISLVLICLSIAGTAFGNIESFSEDLRGSESNVKGPVKDVTHVGVEAKKRAFSWNKDYARSVLAQIENG